MAESIPRLRRTTSRAKVRALAVTSKERNPALPEVPTVIESGIKGFEVVGFHGFWPLLARPRTWSTSSVMPLARCCRCPTCATAW